jgi:3-hydroxy-9,10-secoandrosta-1,3,5(10)-triene-9,17-dione monooxygenase
LVSSILCKEGGIENVDGGYRVAGRFGFASGCHHASWALIGGVVRNEPEQGLISLLVPRSDFEIVDEWHVMGLCGTGSCDLVMDAFVPDYRSGSSLTPQLDESVATKPLYRLPYPTMFSASVTIPLLGAARGALDSYLAGQWDRSRLLQGKVAEEPGTQIRVAESAADLDAAERCLYESFGAMMAQLARSESVAAEVVARTDRDQVLAVQRAVAAVDRVFANSGGRAISLDNPVQRAWRDVHAGAAHAANFPDRKLAAYGALALGV